MAAAETARLIASLELQDKNFTRGIKNVEGGINRVDKKLGAFSGFVNRNMARAIDSIGVRLVSSVGQGLEEMATLEDATTSVTGAIAQVGKGWKTTGADVATAANEIEAATDAAFDDKAIVAATATLIRYGKVSEDNLRPAMEVMTDLAARTGDVGSAGELLGKVLANPAKAAGKLARQGIYLTKAQDKQLKAMVKVNDMAGAQTLLLDILSDTTKDAAKNSGGPYRDALNKLADAGEDLRRGFVTGLAPAILEVSNLLTDELAKPSTMEALKGVGKELGGALKGIIGIAKSLPWETIGTSLKLAGTGAKAVLDAFLGLPPWIQTAVLTGWGLNKLTGGKLFDIGKIAFDFLAGRGSTPANPLFVTDISKGLGGGAPLPGGGGVLGSSRFGAAATLGTVFIAGASIVLLAQTFKGFIDDVGGWQRELLEKVNATSEQGFKETVANLKATNAGIKNMNPLENVLAGIFGGSEIVKNFEMATGRIDAAFKAGELSRDEMITAIGALEETLRLNPEVKLPGTEALLKDLIAAVNKGNKTPPKPEKRPPVSGVGDRPSPGNPRVFQKNVDKIGFDKWVTKAGEIKTAVEAGAQKNNVALSGIKTGISSVGSKQSATNVALSGVKTGVDAVKSQVATGDAQNRARLIATQATLAANAVSAAIQSSLQRLATATAAGRQVTATAGVAPAITPAIYAIGSQIATAIAVNRPIVNTTNVVEKTTVNNRYGVPGDSRTHRP